MKKSHFLNADGKTTTTIVDPFALPTDEKPKTHRRVTLTENTDAFLLNPDGSLNKLGGFLSGKMLKVNMQNPVVKDGEPHFRVENVRHDNIFIPASTDNATTVKASDIAAHVSGIIKKSKVSKFDGDGMREDLTNKAVQDLAKIFEAPKDLSPGLDTYHPQAFIDPELDPFKMNKKGDHKKNNDAAASITENKKSAPVKDIFSNADGDTRTMKFFKFVFPFYGLYDRYNRNKVKSPTVSNILSTPANSTPPVSVNNIDNQIPTEQQTPPPPDGMNYSLYRTLYRNPNIASVAGGIDNITNNVSGAMNFSIDEALPSNEMGIVNRLNNPVLRYRQQGLIINQALQNAQQDYVQELQRMGIQYTPDVQRRSKKIVKRWFKDSDMALTRQVLPDSYYEGIMTEVLR